MKGIELLASVIAILMMIGIISLLGGAIIFILNAISQPSASEIDYEMYLSPIYPPIKYETMLLSYLETTEETSGFQFKKILAYAAYQNNITNIFVDGNNEVTVSSLSSSTYKTFKQWLGKNGYILILNVGGNFHIIAQNKRALPVLPDEMFRIKKISIPLYVDISSERIITEKAQELPLNITLDFYVQ